MEKERNLLPVYTYFETVISPQDLARLIDNFTFDYARMIVLLSQEKTIHDLDTYPQVIDAICKLREFRDTLNLCEWWEKPVESLSTGL